MVCEMTGAWLKRPAPKTRPMASRFATALAGAEAGIAALRMDERQPEIKRHKMYTMIHGCGVGGGV